MVWWVLSVCYGVVRSVDVAGFSLGSSFADKHKQPNRCCAVAQHAPAVWGLLSQPSVRLLEESKKYFTTYVCVCAWLCVRLSVMSGLLHICNRVCLHKPLAGLF